MKLFLVFLFILQSILIANPNKRVIFINLFLPYQAAKNESLENKISNQLKNSLINQNYEVVFLSEPNPNNALKEVQNKQGNLLIGGYYEKDKRDRYIIYAQLYDPTKGNLFDSISITDPLSELDDIKVDVIEERETEEEKVARLSEKLLVKLKSNPDNKTQRENLNEFSNSNLGQNIPFPFPKDNIEQQAQEVFKLLEETNINRQVEVASLFKEDELKVGSTVSSVDESQWKKYGARRNHEAIQYLPSVTHPYTLGGAVATSIRGYTTLLSFAGVAKLIDGVPVNNFYQSAGTSNVANFGLGSTNRIEMIRGPGSAIYGSDAFHGVYSIKSYESEKDSSEIYTEAGSSGFYSGYARGSKGAFDNKLRVHASASGQGVRDQNEPTIYPLYGSVPKVNFLKPPLDSYPPIYYYKGMRKNEYENSTATAKIDYNPTENLSIKAGIYSTAWNGKDFPGTGSGVSLYKDISNLDSKFYMTKFSVEYKLPNDIIVDTTFFYWLQTANFTTNLYFPAPTNEFVKSDSYTKESRYGGNITVKQSKNSWNTQWIASVGLNEFHVSDARANLDTGTITGFRLNTALTIYNNFQWKEPGYDNLKRTIKSSFVQTKTGFFKDRVYVLLGGRLDVYSDFGNQAIPRMGFIFMLTEMTALKTLYGRAFRAPSAQDLKSSGIVLGNNDLKPETIDSFEVSLMHKTKTWKVNLIAFENTWRQGIVRSQKSNLPTPFFAEVENKGLNKAYGSELEFYFNNNKWDFLLAGSQVISKDMTQPEYISYNVSNFRVYQNPSFFTSQNPNGKRYMLFPRYIFSTGAGYTFNWNKLSVFLINRWISNFRDTFYEFNNQYVQNPNSRYLKNYSRLDLTISAVPSDSFEVGLVVRNLLNRKNVLPGTYENSFGILDEELNASVRVSLKL